MKRITALIISAAIVLCGCTAKPTADETSVNPPSSQTNSTEELRAIHSGSLLSNSLGAYGTRLADDQSGYIAYMVDFAEASERVLCEKAECRHNTSDCDASCDGITIYPTENSLLWVFGGDAPNRPASIAESGVYGENRSTLIELTEGRSIYGDSLCIDGDYLYLSVSKEPEIDADGFWRFDRSIIKIDLNSGELAAEWPITQEGYNEEKDLIHTFLVGVYDGELLLAEDLIKDEIFIETKLYTIDAVSGEITQRTALNPADAAINNLQNALFEDKLLCHSGAQNALVSVDVETGRQTKICDMPKGCVRFDIRNAIDGKAVIICSFGDEVSVPYFVDLSTGALTECTLTYYLSAKQTTRPVQIVADAGNRYLVISAANAYVRQATGTDGKPYNIDDDELVYSLISKADYWNNTPNYEDISKVKP